MNDITKRRKKRIDNVIAILFKVFLITAAVFLIIAGIYTCLMKAHKEGGLFAIFAGIFLFFSNGILEKARWKNE